MSSQYATCVEKDGYLYGINGRQDVGVARLRTSIHERAKSNGHKRALALARSSRPMVSC